MYKEIEEKPIDEFDFNETPQRNKHTFVITKDFLKRETNENGKQFYPMSREHRHVIKLGYGKINIKIRPKRKLDKECKTERKCVQVTVESENVKGAKGMVSLFKEIFKIFHSLWAIKLTLRMFFSRIFRPRRVYSNV